MAVVVGVMELERLSVAVGEAVAVAVAVAVGVAVRVRLVVGPGDPVNTSHPSHCTPANLE